MIRQQVYEKLSCVFILELINDIQTPGTSLMCCKICPLPTPRPRSSPTTPVLNIISIIIIVVIIMTTTQRH